MPKSEILDLYNEIAQQEGLVKTAEDSAELKKYKDSEYPRMGSDDIKTIEALYGVRPDGDYDYKNNIIESAHPKPVVIAPSYDRLNGLVENEIERQRININIALTPTNGKNVINPKYAQNDLMMELIRIANDMDNRNKEHLRVLADSCINQLEKKKSKFTKTALIPLIIGAAAIVLAGIWLWQHANDVDEGVVGNLDRAQKELDDLKTNSWYESDVDATVQSQVSTIEEHLNSLRPYIQKFNEIMDQVYKPRTLSEQGELAKFNESVNEYGSDVQKTIEALKAAINEVLPMLIAAISNFTNSEYQKEHTQESWLGEMSGWLGEAAHGRWGLVANDFISAANALNPLIASLKDIRGKLNNFDQIVAQKADEIKQSQETASSSSSQSAPSNLPIQEDNMGQFEYPDIEPSKYKNDEEKGILDQNLQYNQMFDQLGIKPNEQVKEFFKDIMSGK